MTVASRRHELALAVDELHPHRGDVGVGHRLAELVGDAAGEDAAAGECDVNLVHRLRLGQLDRAPRLEGPVLSVLHRHEARLGDAQAEAAGRQILEFVAPLGVGQRGLGADVLAADADLRAAHRTAGVAGDDPAAETPGAGLGLASRGQHLQWALVARADLNRLVDHLLGGGGSAREHDEDSEAERGAVRHGCHCGRAGANLHRRPAIFTDLTTARLGGPPRTAPEGSGLRLAVSGPPGVRSPARRGSGLRLAVSGAPGVSSS